MTTQVEYIALDPYELQTLGHSTVVFNADREMTIQTKHAGDAVHIGKIADRLTANGYTVHLNGSNDGWCFLRVKLEKRVILGAPVAKEKAD